MTNIFNTQSFLLPLDFISTRTSPYMKILTITTRNKIKWSPKFIIQPAGEKDVNDPIKDVVDKIVLPGRDSPDDENSLLVSSSKNPESGLKAKSASKAMQSVMRDLSIIPFPCFPSVEEILL